MFGYIRPLEGELLVKELELYKAAYCGMCRALKSRVSRIMPLALNYDIVLLAILQMALLRTPPKTRFGRCIASPCKAKCQVCVQDNEPLQRCAGVGALLVWFKLADDISDNDKNHVKSAFRRMFKAVIAPSIKKLCKDEMFLRLKGDLQTQLDRLHELERAGCKDIDALAEASGQATALAASAGLEGKQREIALSYGKSIGKWLYVVDAYDDLQSDFDKGCFNPLISAFGDVDKAKEQLPVIRDVLGLYCADAMAQLENLEPTCYDGILKNITGLGLYRSAENVLCPEKAKKPAKHGYF